MFKRIDKYNFYKMEIRADIIYFACMILKNEKKIDINSFYEMFFKKLGCKPKQNNYASALKNFFSYYHILEEKKGLINVINSDIIGFGAESIDHSSALLYFLINFEFENLDDRIKKSIEAIIAKIKINNPVKNQEILDSFNLWFDFSNKKRLKKRFTKDTSQKFLALVISRALHHDIFISSSLTKITNWEYINQEKREEYFIFSKEKTGIYNFLIKYFKENAKNKGKREIKKIKIDLDKIKILYEKLKFRVFEDDDLYYDQSFDENNKNISMSIKRRQEMKEKAFSIKGRKCWINNDHYTFEKLNGDLYVESHHCIWMKNHSIFGMKIEKLDSHKNIIPLCATCHRLVHYGSPNLEKKNIIKRMFDNLVAENFIEDNQKNKDYFFEQYGIARLKN